ncbi:type II secretion system protein [Colwellia sp. RE-S-Sl-9]
MKKINKSPLNTQKGFTLIELVVVIVILGILAATAAPKFIDLTGDAKASTFQAVRASVESATTLVHAKALIAGEKVGQADLNVNGGTNNVGVTNGWPNNEAATWGEILDVDVVTSTSPFAIATSGTTGTDGVVVWYPREASDLTTAQAIAKNCYVIYNESSSSNIKPVIDVIPDGC